MGGHGAHGHGSFACFSEEETEESAITHPLKVEHGSKSLSILLEWPPKCQYVKRRRRGHNLAGAGGDGFRETSDDRSYRHRR